MKQQNQEMLAFLQQYLNTTSPAESKIIKQENKADLKVQIGSLGKKKKTN